MLIAACPGGLSSRLVTPSPLDMTSESTQDTGAAAPQEKMRKSRSRGKSRHRIALGAKNRKNSQRRSASSSKLRIVLALALVLSIAAIGILLSRSQGTGTLSPTEPSASAAGQHIHELARTLIGPLRAASADTNVDLEVIIDLEDGNPQASGTFPSGILVGEKITLKFALADRESGMPLSGLAPTADLQAVHDHDDHQQKHDVAEGTGKQFDVRELFALVGVAGDLSIVDDAPRPSTPGVQLGRAFGTGAVGVIKLPGPSAEATIDRAKRYIFVTIPTRDQVAVVDTLQRRVSHVHPVGKLPFHIAAEPSGKRIWIANDGDGTVSRHDAATHEMRSVRVGDGHHDIAFSSDGSLVFVSNSLSGSVSVVDGEEARKLADVAVGNSPHGLDYSAATQRLYVANEGSGTISVVEVRRGEASHVATIEAGKGASQVRIDPSGQIGIASNKQNSSLTVFSTASNEVIKTVKAGGGPDEIVFLEDYALVRNSLTPDVTFVNLASLDIAGEIELGKEPLLTAPWPGFHARLFPGSGGEEVLAPDPATGQVYRIHVMNGHPMVMGQTKVNLGTDFLISLDNRVQEVAPGVYQRVVRFEREGPYALTITPADGKQPAQFTLEVVSSRVEKPWTVQAVAPSEPYVPGQVVPVQYRVIDRQTGAAVEEIGDGIITVYRFAPGQSPWQKVLQAKHVGDGIYQASVVFTEGGTFSMVFSSREFGTASEDGSYRLEVAIP